MMCVYVHACGHLFLALCKHITKDRGCRCPSNLEFLVTGLKLSLQTFNLWVPLTLSQCYTISRRCHNGLSESIADSVTLCQCYTIRHRNLTRVVQLVRALWREFWIRQPGHQLYSTENYKTWKWFHFVNLRTCLKCYHSLNIDHRKIKPRGKAADCLCVWERARCTCMPYHTQTHFHGCVDLHVCMCMHVHECLLLGKVQVQCSCWCSLRCRVLTHHFCLRSTRRPAISSGHHIKKLEWHWSLAVSFQVN